MILTMQIEHSLDGGGEASPARLPGWHPWR